MADTVTSTTLVDAGRSVVVQLTNESDGTGESAITKLDASALAGTPTDLVIEEIIYATQGMAVKLLWDADTDVLAWTLPTDDSGHVDFRCVGGLHNNSGAGKTGDIKLTTVGHTSGDSYNIVLKCKKR